MKFSTATLCLSATAGARAFPSKPLALRADASTTPSFDAASQLVSVSGIHEFRPPGPNDIRGPCPGLNAMANHGYLERSGFIGILDAVAASKKVFGMGDDLGTILSAYGGVVDGVVAGWSIGGGLTHGIGGSHNNYESDSSPTRGDLYQYGSNSAVVMSQFRELYDMQPDGVTANYDLEVLREFRKNRFLESIAKNPKFMYGPFSGPVVSQAAFIFIYRFMANKTAEAPEGILNKDVLKSFMSVTGPDDNLTWVPGHERVPENWYTRNANDLYGILGGSLSKDFDYIRSAEPALNTPGCNMGKVNTFVPIDVANLTKGAYNSNDILTNPLCFGVAFANTVSNKVPIANTVVQELLLPIQILLGCKTIPSIDESVMEACPGYSFYGGPTADIAEGAIQG